MILIPVILLLGAATYALTVASFAWEDLVFGAALTAVLLAMFRTVLLPDSPPSTRRVLVSIAAFPLFVLGTIREIVTGTWLVARHVVGLRPLEHPGIVRIPIGERTAASRAMAGYVITVSPGTFLVDFDTDTDEMLVHAIDASDPDALRRHYQSLYNTYERHVVPPLPEEARR